MDAILKSIEDAVSAKLWLPAMSLALAVPDMLGQIAFPDPKARNKSRERYARWFDTYVSKRLFSIGVDGPIYMMDGDDAYSFRCAFLHLGEVDVTEQTKSRYRQIVPTSGDLNHMGSDTIMGVPFTLYVGTEPFCKAICEGARAWREGAVRIQPDIAGNLERLLHIMDGMVTISHTLTVGDWTVSGTSITTNDSSLLSKFF